MPTTQRARHDVLVLLGLELGILALKQFQNVLGHFIAHVHSEHVPVTHHLRLQIYMTESKPEMMIPM
jgi:hypothetical protein